MKRNLTAALILMLLGLGPQAWAAKVGEAAPGFTATDTHEKHYKLSDFKGKFLVLEWHNQGCPFVKSQYKGKMQKLQAKWTAQGVQWVSVISSAPHMEGYVTASQADEDVRRTGAHPTAVFLDPKGVLGRAYDAKTTPHMFLIDPKGILVYNGAIDNAPLTDEEVAKTSGGEPYVNYLDRALTELLSKKKERPSIPSTVPYGCHVKYKK